MDFSPVVHMMQSPSDMPPLRLPSIGMSPGVPPDKQQGDAIKYTTVGSIYNPAASLPLQPPARRGRAIKWPLTSASDPTRLPKTVMPILASNNPQGSRADAHLPLTSCTLHYSPLQQNIDRAVSPTTTSDPASHANNMDEHQSICSAPSPSTVSQKINVAAESLTSGNTSVAGWSETGAHKDGDDDTSVDDKLNHFSVKGLTSLASYPNPNQKAAQERLQRARPLHTPSTVTASSQHPLSQNHTWQNTTSHQDTRHPVLIPSVSSSGFSTGSVDVGTKVWHAASTQTLAISKTGIPKPLTAGPPGQRQPRPIGHQIPLIKLLKSRDLVHADGPRGGSPLGTTYNHDTGNIQASTLPTPNSARLKEISAAPDVSVVQHRGSRKVYDTIDFNQTRQWYNGHMPPQFDFVTQSLDAAWIDELVAEQDLIKQSEWRLARASMEFSAGNLYHRSIACDTPLKSHEEMALSMKTASPRSDGRPMLTVAEANMIPTQEHTAELLKFALQSFQRRDEGLRAPVAVV
ncbi:hypothetical protein MN608_02480 [Microdochium nivale]|nr:hypothetical protein MN608_02480 [Microdochium nivale]